MTWKEFLDEVTKLLCTEANRMGAEDYIAAQTRQAVVEVQTKVAGYQMGHEAVYRPEDLISEGMAAVGAMPPGRVTEVWWCERASETSEEWNRREVVAVIIVRVTQVAGDVVTIARGEEGTTARSVVAGWRVILGITAKALKDIEDALSGLIPLQTGNANRVLTTNGSTMYWGAPTGGSPLSPLPDQTEHGGQLLITNGIDANWTLPEAVPYPYLVLVCPDDESQHKVYLRKGDDGYYVLEPDQSPVGD